MDIQSTREVVGIISHVPELKEKSMHSCKSFLHKMEVERPFILLVNQEKRMAKGDVVPLSPLFIFMNELFNVNIFSCFSGGKLMDANHQYRIREFSGNSSRANRKGERDLSLCGQ